LGDAETLASSLTDVVNHSQVVRANFNGIYWLENHSILTSFLNLCHNIRRLDLLETTLGLQEILSLLPQQKNLTSVSLTIRHDEELDIFRKKKPFELGKLRQLTHLELAIEDAVREWDLRFLPYEKHISVFYLFLNLTIKFHYQQVVHEPRQIDSG